LRSRLVRDKLLHDSAQFGKPFGHRHFDPSANLAAETERMTSVQGMQATRRRTIGGLAAAMAGGVLAACGAGGSAPSGEQAAKTSGPVTLVLNGTDSEFGEMAAVRLPQFEQKYANVKVDYQNPPDYSDKLNVLAAAGSLGDVVMTYTNTGQFQYLAQNGQFVPHDPLIARDKYDLKQFYDLAVSALRIDGKLYVLPFKGQIARLFLFYNMDAFQSRGVKEPTAAWTYNDLLDAATKLHKGTPGNVETWGYAAAWKELTTMIGSVRPWGGEIISADGKKALTNSQGVRDALNFHYDLALKKQVGGLTTQIAPDPNTVYYNGQAAMLGRVNAGTAGTVLTKVAGKFRWGAVRMPKGPSGKRGGMWLPGTMSVGVNSKHVDQAWELNKWLCDKESGVQLALQRNGSSTPGARPDVYGDPRLLNRDGYPANLGEEQRQAMLEPEPYVTAANFLGGDVNATLGTELDKITKGEIAVNDGWITNVTSLLQTILDKPVARLK
jgi:multiple sugar transport system substrate-binding protein